MSNIKPHIRISATAVSSTFVDDIRAIIEQGKQQAYMSVNASMIETYWHIGERIVEEEQQGSKRAEYGAQIIDFLAEKLADEYGESYSPRYLRSFRQFYALFPDFDIWKSRFPNLTLCVSEMILLSVGIWARLLHKCGACAHWIGISARNILSGIFLLRNCKRVTRW